ncbi:hypothetical protein Adu01nite_57450 [Paractinoplanes durhamensis]|uniref:ABM domain-containing protein n=1 Tax=Paractinoplanes durhamensis TaxID=113563 RepID=A0ABQ3Z3H8_9ACTN|nr:hypothetical protein Adu01nite_57450 [Actinoplanes durhamensis]
MEFARFTVRAGAEEKLVADRPAMLAALRARFPACLAAYLTREDDGTWVDVLVWRSRPEAEEAAAQITTVPECAAWFQLIAESGGLRHATVLDAWPPLTSPLTDRGGEPTGAGATDFAEVGVSPSQSEAEIQEIGLSSLARGPDIKKIES